MFTSAFKQINILLFVEIDHFRRSYCCRLSFTFSSSESLLNYSDVRAPPVFVCWFMCLFVLRLMFLSASDKEISADLQSCSPLLTPMKFKNIMWNISPKKESSETAFFL